MQQVTKALSAASYINTFVSAAFFNKPGNIISIWVSISLVVAFSNIAIIVRIAFLDNYDLNESTNLISSFIIGYYNAF